MAVYVVGSVNEDVSLQVDRHALPGETITASSSSQDLGGKGLNQAVAAGRAGAVVAMICAVGDDDAGERAVRRMREEGVDPRPSVTEGPTGNAVVIVDAEGANMIIVVPGANGTVTADALVDALEPVGKGDTVLFQLELPLAAMAPALSVAHECGARVVLNAAPFRADIVTHLKHVDVLVVNENELDHLVAAARGEKTTANVPIEHGIAVAAEHRLTIVATRGAEGSYLIDASGVREMVPARSVDVTDTTAAGDTYIGYLVAALDRGSNWAEAMWDGSVAASIAVGRSGAVPSIPTRADVDDVLMTAAQKPV